jgi:hypothetical protein
MPESGVEVNQIDLVQVCEGGASGREAVPVDSGEAGTERGEHAGAPSFVADPPSPMRMSVAPRFMAESMS